MYTKLYDTNYLAWVCQFLPILWTNGLSGIVDGSEPYPVQFILEPETKDSMVLNPDFVI